MNLCLSVKTIGNEQFRCKYQAYHPGFCDHVRLPVVGHVYSFTSESEGCDVPLAVTKVTDTHVYYKFIDHAERRDFAYRQSHPMRLDVWLKNQDGRVLIGTSDEPETIHFFTFTPARPEDRE